MRGAVVLGGGPGRIPPRHHVHPPHGVEIPRQSQFPARSVRSFQFGECLDAPSSIAAGIGAAGAIGGAVLGSSAREESRQRTAGGGRAAIDEQKRQYDLNRADLAPWRTAGGQPPSGRASTCFSPATTTPQVAGYQFRLDEGLRGVQNSAAAKGLLQSGGTLKGIDKYPGLRRERLQRPVQPRDGGCFWRTAGDQARVQAGSQ
jgi:hypothetical protein